ncbi:FAD-dependent oxidoreductase [Rhizobium yanglingense]
MPKRRAGARHSTTAEHIIVATGARPRALPGIEPDGKLIWTDFEAHGAGRPCRSRSIVMGWGAIGIEFACFYRTDGRRR